MMKDVSPACSGDRGYLMSISVGEGRFQGRMDTVRSGEIRKRKTLPSRVCRGRVFEGRSGA